MKKTLSVAAALVAAFAFTAGADEYDLVKLADRNHAVGATYHEVNSETEHQKQTVSQGGNVVQQMDRSKTTSYDRTVEVLAVNDKGKPTKTKVTFKSFSLKQGEETKDLSVDGLVVTVDASGDATTVTAEGGKEVPGEVEEFLKAEASKAKNKDEKGPRQLLPENPVAMGAEWSKDPTKAVEQMGIPAAGLDTAASSCKGTLTKGETHALKINLKLHLVFTTFQGMPCEEPVVIDLDFTIETTAEGAPYQVETGKMNMAGKISANGAEVVMDMKSSQDKTVSAGK